MKDANRFNKNRLTDHTVNCDICGTVCWYSETRTLQNETGQGGALVCSRHNDPIDYGLVPYKARAEQPVRETRILSAFNDTTNITGTTPYDLSTNNPLSEN